VRPILVARREERLQALADELVERHGLQAPVLVADLSRPGSAASLFAETERLGLAVDLLVNNAGFGKGGEFTDLPLEVQAAMVRLNVQALVDLTWLYLPTMRQRRRGGVINVASTAAWQPVPRPGGLCRQQGLCPAFFGSGGRRGGGRWSGGHGSLSGGHGDRVLGHGGPLGKRSGLDGYP